MKVLVLILLLIGLGVFAAVGLSTLTVVMIMTVSGWVVTVATFFRLRKRRMADRHVRVGRFNGQERV